MATIDAPAELYRTATILERDGKPSPRIRISKGQIVLQSRHRLRRTKSISAFATARPSWRLYCSRFAVGTAVPRERQQLRLFSPPVHEAGSNSNRGRLCFIAA